MLNLSLKIFKRSVSCSCLLNLHPVPMFAFHSILQGGMLMVKLWSGTGTLGIQERIRPLFFSVCEEQKIILEHEGIGALAVREDLDNRLRIPCFRGLGRFGEEAYSGLTPGSLTPHQLPWVPGIQLGQCNASTTVQRKCPDHWSLCPL